MKESRRIRLQVARLRDTWGLESAGLPFSEHRPRRWDRAAVEPMSASVLSAGKGAPGE